MGDCVVLHTKRERPMRVLLEEMVSRASELRSQAISVNSIP